MAEPKRRGTFALVVAIIDIVGYAILSVASLQVPGSFDAVSAVLFGGSVASFALMGALLVRRVPTNRILTDAEFDAKKPEVLAVSWVR